MCFLDGESEITSIMGEMRNIYANMHLLAHNVDWNKNSPFIPIE